MLKHYYEFKEKSHLFIFSFGLIAQWVNSDRKKNRLVLHPHIVPNVKLFDMRLPITFHTCYVCSFLNLRRNRFLQVCFLLIHHWYMSCPFKGCIFFLTMSANINIYTESNKWKQKRHAKPQRMRVVFSERHMRVGWLSPVYQWSGLCRFMTVLLIIMAHTTLSTTVSRCKLALYTDWQCIQCLSTIRIDLWSFTFFLKWTIRK